LNKKKGLKNRITLESSDLFGHKASNSSKKITQGELVLALWNTFWEKEENDENVVIIKSN